MNNIIERTWKQGCMVGIEDMRGLTFQNEALAHTFKISGVDADGSAIALTGTPAGVMLRADNLDVALTCALSDGCVTASLPAECYDVPGRAEITIYLTEDGHKVCIYAAIVSVNRTSSGTASPGTAADVVDLVNLMQTSVDAAADSATDAAGSATSAAASAATASAAYNVNLLAPNFVQETPYPAGQHVIYDGGYYVLPNGHEADVTWENTSKTQQTVGGELTDLKSALDASSYDVSFTPITGKYLGPNGATNNYSPFNIADYIPLYVNGIKTDIVFELVANSSTYMCFYDQNKTLISEASFAPSSGSNKPFIGSSKSCETAYYMRLSYKNDLPITIKRMGQIENLIDLTRSLCLDNEIAKMGVNHFNPNDPRIMTDKSIQSASIQTISGYYVSHPLIVEKGKTYKYPMNSADYGGSAKMCYVDGNGNIYNYFQATVTNNFVTFTAPETGFILVNIKNISSFMFCIESEYPNTFTKYVGYSLNNVALFDWTQAIVFDEDIAKMGVNHFNKNDARILTNKLIQTASVVAASGYYVSHPILVEKGKIYKYPLSADVYGGNGYMCYIDRNGNTYDYFVIAISSNFVTFTAPSSGYILVNVGADATAVASFMFCLESEYPASFTEFVGYTLNNVLPFDWTPAVIFDKDIAKMGINHFNPNDTRILTDKLIQSASVVTASGFFVSHPILVEKGKSYKYYQRGAMFGATAKMCYVDGNGNYYNFFQASNSSNYITFTAPLTGFMLFNMESKNSMMFCLESEYPESFTSYIGYTLNNVIQIESRLRGKKIAYDGDSICQNRYRPGQNDDNGGAYAKLIADTVGGTFVNNAVGGGTLTTGDDTKHRIVDCVDDLPSDADLICFEGGINDYWGNVPLGDYTAGTFSDTLDTTTICGALESIFRQAWERWPGKPIVFVIVHKIQRTAYTYNQAQTPYTWTQVYEKIVGICKKYSIPYYDCFNEGGLTALSTYMNEAYLNSNSSGTADGCHPNEAGYRKYYVPQLIALFESVLPYDTE